MAVVSLSQKIFSVYFLLVLPDVTKLCFILVGPACLNSEQRLSHSTFAAMTSSPVSSDQTKTKRPSSSKFRQQQLPAWQPILTAGTVLPTFFVIGVAFIPVGIALLTFSGNVQEVVKEYTHCNSTDPAHDGASCDEVLRNTTAATPCTCNIDFNITESLNGRVYMYYGLSNFYQNHRRYVKSRDVNQLTGQTDSALSDCKPFATSEGKSIAPCGAIANSLFNDTFELQLLSSSGAELKVPLVRTGIAWPSDKKHKFQVSR